ncbi:MAG: hypothetical protein L3J16_00045 [Anaerolineales bacterium]|nr:hypothetical protein [Anaerolineales bacterium]
MNSKKLLGLVVLLLAIGVSACAPTAASTPAKIIVPTPGENNTPVPPPTSPPVTIVTKTLATFDTGNSGSICPQRSPELDLGDPPSIIGEAGDTYTWRGFWTFNLYDFPKNAQVLSATFAPGPCTVNGNPFAYTDMLGFEFVDVGTLDVGDYGQGGTGWAVFETCPTSVDMTSYVQSRVSAGYTSLQIRAFLGAGSYGNGTDDYISYRTGNVPTLTIEYSYTQ